ncbi:MAG TPA: AGE family epimerase/isomerase [Steroidobacteraceae bacterium]|nr:AGE family epimerase/isomerase [Steroidobacteraceae bacterium]
MSSSVRSTLRNEIELELHRLAAVWFPRSVDRQHGGFLCNFNYRWRLRGSQEKMLEYQARQTIAAARAAAHSPQLAFLHETASHGFRYLKQRMWDQSLGGWYRCLNQSGDPLEGATKHGHGTAYAISACVACYDTTGDPECLELAKLAFSWLEQHAHDAKHGGYFVFYGREGQPILSTDQGHRPAGDNRDAIGTPIGCKDANTTSDLLKSFADLYRVWPDPLLRQRLEEVLCIVRDRLVVAPGLMHMYAHSDWTPLPDVVRYGQILRTAIILLSASESLFGTLDSMTERIAKSMIDTMLRIAWDRDQGGFHLAGSSFGPLYLEDTVVFVRDKVWWAQADGLRALSAMARLHPDDRIEYASQFVRLWQYVKKYVIDAKRGGWLAAGLDTNPQARRGPKATVWKDSSHEIEALLDSLRLLNSL